VAHQGRVQVADVSGDQQVIGADGEPGRCKLGPDGTGFARCGGSPGQDFDILQERPNNSTQGVAALAAQNPILQLEESDDGDPDLLT
jgi:hypothetical protein